MGGRRLRAIDLYSGIGGWSLGLRLAGIDVLQSYEWWEVAAATGRANSRHKVIETDIRELPLDQLPDDIDIIVGSPPCTQFSTSNRGGGGDFREGLKDVIKFLEIVQHCKPRFWLMENVPRLSNVIAAEAIKGGILERFSNMYWKTDVLGLHEFGLPQRRKRCFVGNIDFDLLRSYGARQPGRSLGDVVSAVSTYGSDLRL